MKYYSGVVHLYAGKYGNLYDPNARVLVFRRHFCQCG